MTFTGQFIAGQVPETAIAADWAAFRAALTGNYNTFTISSNLGGSVTVTDATGVQDLSDGLFTATATIVSIKG